MSPKYPTTFAKNMSSDACLDDVFLESCHAMSIKLATSSHISPTNNFGSLYPTSTLVVLSRTPYEFAILERDEDRDGFISDSQRVAAFYPNATYDFYGVPSAALCVYKTGSAWPVRTGPQAQRIIRQARPVYNHPLQPFWRELGARFCRLFDGFGLRWTSIDPFFFADKEGTWTSPLLFWIGVEPESLEFGLANTVAEAATKFITEAGGTSFEIGFRESVVVTHSVAGPRLLSFDPFHDPISEFKKAFTPTLGFAIAPLKTPYYEGTGTLFLRDGDRVLLLTCAHVARPPLVNRNTGLSRKTTGSPREKIIALGVSGYASALKSIMGAIGDLDRSIADWQAVLERVGQPQEDEAEHITEKREEHQGLINKARKKMGQLDTFHNGILKHWTVPDDRVIGEVIHVEPGAEPYEYTRDWALVELYKKKFDWDTFLGNKIYVGGNLSQLDWGKIMFPRGEDRKTYAYPKDGLLQAHGVIELSDIRNPEHLDGNGDQCLLVVKNGLATGTTVGRVNGMESFTRTYVGNGIESTSVGIAVLPYNSNGPFSAPGDSGSLVVDRDGRILGALTGGSGSTNRTDVTYVTPYRHLEQGVRKHFPKSFLYEVVE